MKQGQLTPSLYANEKEVVNDLMKLHQKEIQDIQKLDAKFDLEKFKAELRLQSKIGRKKLISLEWVNTFKEYVEPKLNDIQQSIKLSKTTEEFLNCLDRKQEFISSAQSEYKDAYAVYSKAVKNDRNKGEDLAQTHNQTFLKELRHEVNIISKIGYFEEPKLLSVLKDMNDLNRTQQILHKACSDHFEMNVRKDLHYLETHKEIKNR